jgi:AcrR family transcriptional regulator
MAARRGGPTDRRAASPREAEPLPAGRAAAGSDLGPSSRRAGTPMRERIMAAAARVISERGVTGATTKEIARAAGVSEGSLYNHFESKTALFGAAFGSVAAGIREAMGELAGSVGRGTIEGNLERLAIAAIRFYRELLPMAGPALADHDVTSWLRRGMPARGAGPIMGQLALVGYLEAERDAGRLAPTAEPGFMAAALLGACLQRAFTSILTEPTAMASAGIPEGPGEYARGIVRTVLERQLA